MDGDVSRVGLCTRVELANGPEEDRGPCPILSRSVGAPKRAEKEKPEKSGFVGNLGLEGKGGGGCRWKLIAVDNNSDEANSLY